MIYRWLLNIVDKTHFTNEMFGAGNPDKANRGLVVCVKQISHEKKLLNMQATSYELRAASSVFSVYAY